MRGILFSLLVALAANGLVACATGSGASDPDAPPKWTRKGPTDSDALFGVGHSVTPRHRVLRGNMAKNRAFARLMKTYETCGSRILADWIKTSAPSYGPSVGRWAKTLSELLHQKMEIASAWDDSNN
ncbi:MAG: hypothetical protein AAF449_24265, partial [Myxococcota bacterium]